jgi:hypothetical protein
MISKDPKKMADGVLARAFGGEVSSGKKGNFKAPSAGSEPVPGYAEGGEVDEGKVLAASEILEALSSKDSAALASALQSFVEQCQSYDEDSVEIMDVE